MAGVSLPSSITMISRFSGFNDNPRMLSMHERNNDASML